MATKLAIDERLLNDALRIGGHKTKKATVTEALQEYVQRRRQVRAINLFGKIDFDPSYDYKQHRTARERCRRSGRSHINSLG